MKLRYCVLVPFVIWAIPGAVRDARAFPDVSQPPAGWQVIKRVEATGEQLSAVRQKLGCPIRAVSNTVLEKDGRRVQVNLIDGGSPECAEAVREIIVRGHGGDGRFCLREGDILAEFVGQDTPFILQSRSLLGFLESTVTYAVEMDVAPLRDGDCSQWNDLFQSAVAIREGPDTAAARVRLEALAAEFSFSSRLCLPRTSPGGHRIEYVTEPASADPGDGELAPATCRELGEVPRWERLPEVHVKARVTVSAGAPTAQSPPAAELTAPTRWWPSDRAEVRTLAAGIVDSAATDGARLEVLLRWMRPGANVQFGGETGSRVGVPRVLDERRGHCWDFSDLFISLCRACGLPARQVGGWLVGRSGHVWAEVYLAGEGWIGVDPTAAARCDTEYVPLWVSEDGMIPLVYLGVPVIRKVPA